MAEMRDQANELKALESMLSDASAEPTKLSYALLKSVTRNFSRMIGRGGFGAVYLVYFVPDYLSNHKFSDVTPLK